MLRRSSILLGKGIALWVRLEVTNNKLTRGLFLWMVTEDRRS